MRPLLASLLLVLMLPATATAASIKSDSRGLQIDASGDGGGLRVNVSLSGGGTGPPEYIIRYSHFVLDAFGDPGPGCAKLKTDADVGRGVRCSRTAGLPIKIVMTNHADTVTLNPIFGDPIASAALSDRAEVQTLNGEDNVAAGTGPVEVNLGSGDDRFNAGTSGGFADPVLGFTGDDTIVGGTRSDLMQGDDGNDRIEGHVGNDTLIGSAGLDTIIGQDGNDSLDGGEGNDGLDGGSGDDSMTGGDGIDNFSGQDGNDTMVGGAGDDAMGGQGGDDTLSGGSGNDRLNGGPGADSHNGSIGNDALIDNSPLPDGADVFSGGTGVDTMTYSTRTTKVDALFDGEPNDGAPGEGDNLIGIDSITFGAGDDFLFSFIDDGTDTALGGPGDDRLLPGGGDDTINGGTGVDVLNGGAGNDILQSQDGVTDESLACSAGVDQIFSDLRDAGVISGCESITKSPAGEPMPLSLKPFASRAPGRRLKLAADCPRSHRKPCSGVVAVRSGRAVVGRSAFRVLAGRKASVQVKVKGAVKSGLVAKLTEKGKAGMRSSEATVVVR